MIFNPIVAGLITALIYYFYSLEYYFYSKNIEYIVLGGIFLGLWRLKLTRFIDPTPQPVGSPYQASSLAGMINQANVIMNECATPERAKSEIESQTHLRNVQVIFKVDNKTGRVNERFGTGVLYGESFEIGSHSYKNVDQSYCFNH